MKKRICSLLLAAVMLAAFCLPLGATGTAETPEEEYRWTCLNYFIVTLDLNGGSAACSWAISGNSNVTSIAANVELRRQIGSDPANYVIVRSLPTQSVTGSFLSGSTTVSVPTGYTYWLVVTAKVYTGSSYESGTESDSGVN